MEQESKVTQIGWDCHRQFSQVALRDATGRIVERRRIEHADRERMRKRLRSWPRGTPVVLEGSFGWSWVSDELAEAGLAPHLASSRKLAAWRAARGLAKSNRLDADLMSGLMSEPERWWEVWLAPQAVRDQRELLRYRMALVQTQTRFKNRIHAILHRHGVLHEFSDLFGRDGRRFLQQLAGARNSPLRENARVGLRGELQLLDHLRLQIARVTKLFRQRVTSSPIAQRRRQQAREHSPNGAARSTGQPGTSAGWWRTSATGSGASPDESGAPPDVPGASPGESGACPDLPGASPGESGACPDDSGRRGPTTAATMTVRSRSGGGRRPRRKWAARTG